MTPYLMPTSESDTLTAHINAITAAVGGFNEQLMPSL